MTAAEARELAHAETFRPFRVVTRDGRRFEAPTYADVLASMGELLIGVNYDPQTGVAEAAAHLRYEDIRDYEFLMSDTAVSAA